VHFSGSQIYAVYADNIPRPLYDTNIGGKTIMMCDVSIWYSVTHYTKIVSVKTQTPHRNKKKLNIIY